MDPAGKLLQIGRVLGRVLEFGALVVSSLKFEWMLSCSFWARGCVVHTSSLVIILYTTLLQTQFLNLQEMRGMAEYNEKKMRRGGITL